MNKKKNPKKQKRPYVIQQQQLMGKKTKMEIFKGNSTRPFFGEIPKLFKENKIDLILVSYFIDKLSAKLLTDYWMMYYISIFTTFRQSSTQFIAAF